MSGYGVSTTFSGMVAVGLVLVVVDGGVDETPERCARD